MMDLGADRIGPAERWSVRMPGGRLFTTKVTAERTGWAYSLFEVEVGVGGAEGPHVQHREDECFYVLQGEFQFLNGTVTLRAGAGSLLYIPKGTLHAHKNVGEGVGRLLVAQTPGGLYERFFEEVGKPVDGDGGSLVFEEQPDLGRIVAVAAEHGIEIPSPITHRARSRNTTKRGQH